MQRCRLEIVQIWLKLEQVCSLQCGGDVQLDYFLSAGRCYPPVLPVGIIFMYNVNCEIRIHEYFPTGHSTGLCEKGCKNEYQNMVGARGCGHTGKLNMGTSIKWHSGLRGKIEPLPKLISKSYSSTFDVEFFLCNTTMLHHWHSRKNILQYKYTV